VGIANQTRRNAHGIVILPSWREACSSERCWHDSDEVLTISYFRTKKFAKRDLPDDKNKSASVEKQVGGKDLTVR
jgi:hypothetical protein